MPKLGHVFVRSGISSNYSSLYSAGVAAGVDAAPRPSDSDEFRVSASLNSGSERQLGLRHPDSCRTYKMMLYWRGHRRLELLFFLGVRRPSVKSSAEHSKFEPRGSHDPSLFWNSVLST